MPIPRGTWILWTESRNWVRRWRNLICSWWASGMTRSYLSKRDHLVPGCHLAAPWTVFAFSSALCPGPSPNLSDYQSFSSLVNSQQGSWLTSAIHPTLQSTQSISSTTSLGSRPLANQILLHLLSLIIVSKKRALMQITMEGLCLHNVFWFTKVSLHALCHIKPRNNWQR